MAEINKLDINGYTMQSIYAKIGISYDRFVELLDRDFYTPTLTSAPTTSTLTYTDTDGSVCEFRVGQSCVYPDGSKFDGWGISILKAITDDGAVWEKFLDLAYILNIKLTSSTNTNSDLIGATITVTEQQSGAVIEEKVWDGSELSVVVQNKGIYSISVTEVDGYISPSTKNYELTVRGVHNVEIIYEKPSWITLNQTITDPATMLSGDINGTHIQAIRANSHRYLGKYTAEGTMTICQLDDTDSNLYKDGTAATLTGEQGDVFMKLPRFWYQAKERATNIWDIGFYYGNTVPAGNWKEWDGKDLIGVYEAYNTGSKVYSRSGVTSTDSVSQSNFKAYASARGTGFSLVKWKHHNIMAFLYYAMYGHMNCQAQIGKGTNSNSKQTGQTNALGMEDTVAGVNGNSQSINFWGLENWWGNKYEFVDNITMKASGDNCIISIIEDDGTVRNITTPKIVGYLKTAIIGEHLDLITSSGESATGAFYSYCDQHIITTSTTDTITLMRSGSSDDVNGGIISVFINYNINFTNNVVGSRLAFRGEIVEIKDVETFHSISPIS